MLECDFPWYGVNDRNACNFCIKEEIHFLWIEIQYGVEKYLLIQFSPDLHVNDE